MTPACYLFAGNCLLSTNPQELRAAAEEALQSDPRWLDALAIDPLDLEREYVRLFLDPGGAPCPLWQSAHGLESDSPTLMGHSHSSALAFYREYRLEPARGSEPADHAGLLLLFAGVLLKRGIAEEEFERYSRWTEDYQRRLQDDPLAKFGPPPGESWPPNPDAPPPPRRPPLPEEEMFD